MKLISGVIVLAMSLYLLGLAVVIIVKPRLAEGFLDGFASSAFAHYAEQTVRLIAGAGLVIFADSMWYPDLFKYFAWIIIISTVGLLLIPWQWHRKFAEWAIPLAIRNMNFLAVGAFLLGAFTLYAASRSLFF